MQSRTISTVAMTLARVTLLGAAVVAPWLFGGYPLEFQLWLGIAVLVAMAAWTVAQLTRPASGLEEYAPLVPPLTFPAMLLLLLIAVQLAPLPLGPKELEHAVSDQPLVLWVDAPNRPLSIDTGRTRVALAKFTLAFCAFLLGANLFRQHTPRRWLWGAMAVNGVALAIFGLVQRANWNGMLYWSVPLRFGGNPFASYVNRNNAAGWLNLALAAAIGWTISACLTRQDSRPKGSKQREAPEPRYAISFSQTTWPFIIGVALVVLNAVGVCGSLSRGGILAMTGGLVAVALLLGRQSLRIAVVSVAVAAVLGAVVINESQIGDSLRRRFAEFEVESMPGIGRLAHWSDTFGAVQDFPLAGTGLNTYRYANLPYQSQAQDNLTYYNADNIWFEWLVELGAIGSGLTLLMGVLLVLRLQAMARWQSRAPIADATLAGVFLFCSQFLHGLTDFGLILLANTLGVAVILGAVVGAGAGAGVRTAAGSAGAAPRLGRGYSVIGGVAFVGVLALALTEVRNAARASEIWDPQPHTLAPDSYTPAEAEVLIGRAESLLRIRPDDTELRRALAKLYAYRYQLDVYEDLTEANHRMTDAWQRTSLLQLHGVVCRLSETATVDELRQRFDEPVVRDNLKPAAAHALLGRRLSPLQPDWNQMLACLAFLFSDDPTGAQYIREAAARNPNRPSLVLIGLLAAQAEQRELAAACWQAVLRDMPHKLRSIGNIAEPFFSDAEFAEQVLPVSTDLLLSFIDMADDEGRQAALGRAERILDAALKSGSSAPSHFAQRGQIAMMRGQAEAAIEDFERAIELSPLTIPWRLTLVELLLDQGRTKEAAEQVDQAAKLAPRDPKVRRLWSQVNSPGSGMPKTERPAP